MKKTTQLKRILESRELEFLMEAHSGLSARIVEEAGFEGVWASGLTISASLGVRDNNEASWTQVLEILEFMSDASTIPILVDGDTGYGNFNNMRRLVRKLEQRSVAGVCIEDKLFPKTNSFIDGERQQLADVGEFCGKIKAAKDTQADDDFCIIARVEALIAGWGVGEALDRAAAYHGAGADAVLIHSKRAQPDEILAFMKAWGNTCPVVIVPTMYYSTPTEVFRKAGISLVIWANHLLRAGVGAMQRTAAAIHRDQNLYEVEDQVVSVRELFRLQGAEELAEAERRYLPTQPNGSRAIILAASRGEDLGSLTDERPKAMLEVHGEPLLHKLIDQFQRVGVRDLAVVAGYRHDTISVPSVKKLVNEEYAVTKELYSLACAEDLLEGETFISFGDILFRRFILLTLQAEEGDIVLVVDSAVDRRHSSGRYTDFVTASRSAGDLYTEDPVLLMRMDPHADPVDAHGEWIGLLKLSAAGARQVRHALENLRRRQDFEQLRMSDLFNHMTEVGQPIHIVFISGHWLDVDDIEVYSQAKDF